MNVASPKAHGDKLKALLTNGSLPASDKPRVQAIILKYDAWVEAMDTAQETGSALLEKFVSLLNAYKTAVELELIFDSPENFLYRQNGQIKLANSVLEEFLPRIFDVRLVPGLGRLSGIACGPRKCFSHLSFGSPFLELDNGGVFIKTKDQDFAVSKAFTLTIQEAGAGEGGYNKQVSVSYFASEIKTNLDKTMFQEANATAGELKAAVPGARYVLLCEWLDMAPIDTKLTPIDEVVILRKAKRLSSNVRDQFSTAAGRQSARPAYVKHLEDHPLSVDSFKRLIFHLQDVFPNEPSQTETTILQRGYF